MSYVRGAMKKAANSLLGLFRGQPMDAAQISTLLKYIDKHIEAESDYFLNMVGITSDDEKFELIKANAHFFFFMSYRGFHYCPDKKRLVFLKYIKLITDSACCLIHSITPDHIKINDFKLITTINSPLAWRLLTIGLEDGQDPEKFRPEYYKIVYNWHKRITDAIASLTNPYLLTQEEWEEIARETDEINAEVEAANAADDTKDEAAANLPQFQPPPDPDEEDEEDEEDADE